MELIGVHGNVGQRRVEVERQRNRARKCLAQEARKLADLRIGVQDFAPHLGLARERQYLLHQCRAAPHRLRNHADAFLQLFRVSGHARDQGGIPGDDCQNVVDVMGNAAGQRPDALQFLRLQELTLEAVALGDVHG